MAKKSGKQGPDVPQPPKELPHDPPMDDIADVVEFVDDDSASGAASPHDPVFTFADEPDFNPPAAQASDSVPHVPHATPAAKAAKGRPQPKETDSVLEDDLVNLGPSPGLDSAQVSGIFSSVIRQESESAVLSNSEIIRAAPLSDAVAIDPLSGIVSMKTDSEVRAVDSGILVEEMTIDDVDVVEDAVLESEITGVSTSEIALPESAVREEQSSHEDAIGQEDISGINDSSVSLKSFRGSRKSPEKEAVLDLDDALAGLDSPQPKVVSHADATAAFETGSSDDIDFDEIIVEADDMEGSAVNLGQKPPRSASNSGIDAVAEALESGVRLDEAPAGKFRVASPPSVEFDELIVEDDLAAVDLGAEDSPKPKKASAKLPKSKVEDVSDLMDDGIVVVDVDEATDADQPATVVADDDVNIDELLDSAVTDVAPALEEEEVVDVVDQTPDYVPEPEPTVTMPRRGKRAAVSTALDVAPAPYSEPQKRGGWGGLISGVVLGGLLTAAAGAGVWFGDLLPKDKTVVVENKVVPPSPLQAARDAIEQGKYEDALAQLKDADADKSALALRGEARWLAYLQKQTTEQAALNAKDDEVVAAIEDLKKSENQVKLQQVQGSLQSALLMKIEVEQARKTEKSLTEDLVKANSVVAVVEKSLREAKVLGEDDKLDIDTVQKATAELGEAKVSLAMLNKVLDEAKIEGGAKGIEKLLVAKKDFEDKFGEVNKALADEKVKDSGAKGLAEVFARRDKLAKDRDELDLAVKAALQELSDAKLVPAGTEGPAGLVAGAKAARTRTESPIAAPLGVLADSLGGITLGVSDLVKSSFDTAAAVAEINLYRAREALAATPEQQLDRLAAALANRDEKNALLIADANRLAEWIATQDAKASDAAKAKALFAQGLAQRNQQQYAEARQSLQKASELVKDDSSPWAGQVRRSFAELSDPAVYYIPRIEKLRADGNAAAALSELNSALAVIPNHPRLMSERGLISLDEMKGGLDDATKAVIRADAEAAVNDPKTAASGNFVLGRLEEQGGNFVKAEAFFRQALKIAAPDDEQAALIRLRLGRLLLRDRFPAAAPVPPPAPKVEDKEASDAAGSPTKVSLVHPLSGLLVAAILSQPGAAQDEENPEIQARVKETIDLARQLLTAKDKKVRAQGHMLLGEALSRIGQRTEGLREIAKGLEILHPDLPLSKLLDEHPGLSAPETLQRANPLLAEKHYGLGLHHYHEHRFAEAENEFRLAIASFDKDARYFYFLGLAEFEQRKQSDAFQAWSQAHRLEANSRPTTREINLSLERIQGERRAYLNSYRGKASTAP
jgi:Flp pilus assembly protein TadD